MEIKKMKINDIESKYFNHLINYCKQLESMCEDISGFYKTDTRAELLAMFPSKETLFNMRQSNSELTKKQWEDFWKVIEDVEVNIARTRVTMSKQDVETCDFNKKYPIKFDKDGYSYRNVTRDYIEMGE